MRARVFMRSTLAKVGGRWGSVFWPKRRGWGSGDALEVIEGPRTAHHQADPDADPVPNAHEFPTPLNHASLTPVLTLPRLRWYLMTLASVAALSCGPGEVAEDETWMLGSFSAGGMPCSASGIIERYEVYEDGRFEISYVEPGYTRTWKGFWEQQGPGRIRVVRDEADPGSPNSPHPIEPGEAWEICSLSNVGSQISLSTTISSGIRSRKSRYRLDHVFSEEP